MSASWPSPAAPAGSAARGGGAWKRALDVAGAAAGLLLFSPVLAFTAAAVWLEGRPVLFRQERPGLHGRPFVMYKFRTMRGELDASGNPVPDEDRITRLGHVLRATSLDELPELFNVLRGDMSLVGPRPLLTEYLQYYTPQQARRHDVKPGITGWAAVNGRNAITWEEKFRLDVWYVENRSLLLDLKILLLTVSRVVRRHGVSPDDQVIMPRFRGTSADAGPPGRGSRTS